MMLLALLAMMQCLPSYAEGTHHQRSDIIAAGNIICPTGQTSLKKALASASALFFATYIIY